MTTDRHIQAVVFDLDDTLFAERDYVRSGYHAVGEYLRVREGVTERVEDWLWQRFEGGRASGAFDAMNEHFQRELSDEQIAELVRVYRGHAPSIQPREGVPELLSELHGACNIGLLSDGYLPTQQLKFDAMNLAGHFDVVLFTESLGREFWKPSPVGYEKLQEAFGLPHECCVYVGDNPKKDFVAPNALGWSSVQLLLEGQVHSNNPAPPGGEAQAVVESVAALELLLLGNR